MESACIRHCTLDARDVCIGCARTLDEIMRWTIMTADERRAVMKRLEQPSSLSRRNPPST